MTDNNPFMSGKIEIGVPIELNEPDNFHIVKETLTRIGIAQRGDNVLYQTAHILHKRGQYAIVHFKEMFMLDGKHAFLQKEDIARRNTVAQLLEDWELVTIKYPDSLDFFHPVNDIKIVPHKEKKNWELVPKYTIGKREKKENDNG